MAEKIRILFYGDAPNVATGFGTVSRNILVPLHNTGKYDIRILGINHWGDPHPFPFPIWPIGVGGKGDPYGRQRASDMMRSDQFPFDILFMIQDSFILEFMTQVMPHLRQSKKFTSVVYYPVDGVPKSQWIQAMSIFDHPVTYTEFAKQESILACPSMANRLQVISHGVNMEDFYPLPDAEVADFKRQFFGKHADKFVITNVNRNQQRKDIPRTLVAFREFKKRRPNSAIYLHMAAQDQGWNLPEVVRSIGLQMGEDVLMPGGDFGPNQGYPLPILNFIYNASDAVVSTTLGEGFGLSTVEAMACKTPIIFPNNTSLTEIIGANEERGYLVPSGATPSDLTILPNDNEVLRPLTDVRIFAEKLMEVYDNRDEAKKKTDAAYEWIRSNLQWTKHIAPQWDKLLTEAVIQMVKSEASGSKVVAAEDL